MQIQNYSNYKLYYFIFIQIDNKKKLIYFDNMKRKMNEIANFIIEI